MGVASLLNKWPFPNAQNRAKQGGVKAALWPQTQDQEKSDAEGTETSDEPDVKKPKSGMEKFFGRHFGLPRSRLEEWNSGNLAASIPTLASVRNQVKLELVMYDNDPLIATSDSPPKWCIMKQERS